MPSFWTILAIVLTWNAAPWLVLGWLFSPVLPGGSWTVLAVAVLLFLPVVLVARRVGGNAYPSAVTRLWIYRPVWYSQLFLPLLAVTGLAGSLAGLPFGVPQLGGRWAVGGVGLILALVSLWGYAGTRRLVALRLEVSFPDLPSGLEGMRIAQLSDLHVGPHTSRRHLRRVVEAVEGVRPDLIVLTGDQVDDFAGDVEPLGRAFGGLSAPLGILAVAGNHDVYAGWEPVQRGMEALGWTVLVNRAIPLERNGSRFWVAGTGDPAGGSRPGDSPVAPDVERTLAGVPEDAFTLVLAHNPALWPALAARGADLTLSGHTHHGQLSVPRLGWSMASVFLDLAMGLHRRGDSVLYISPGTNYWGIPFRLGALPEVTVVALHRRAAASTGSGDAAADRAAAYERFRGGGASANEPASSISKSAKSKPGPTVHPTSA